MLYATLAAWGMHRMGDPEATKTKLTVWDSFHGSIVTDGAALQKFRRFQMLGMSEAEYSEAVFALRPHYRAFNLSISRATVVVNSKALFHLFPEFIPPIDRQYTLRFFAQVPERWRDSRGKFRMVNLPAHVDRQFELFHRTCAALDAVRQWRYERPQGNSPTSFLVEIPVQVKRVRYCARIAGSRSRSRPSLTVTLV